MARRSGLGRGLHALIPNDSVEEKGELRHIPLDQIEPNQYQPRAVFNEEDLAGLTESVREMGVLQPIRVRPSGENKYELIAGERRWRAARRAGLAAIPAIVKDTDNLASLEQALVENLQRADLNPIEEAAAYQQLVDDFDLTQDQVASRVGKSRSAVANALRLFQLSPTIQKLIVEGRLSAGHARALLGIPDRAVQERLAARSTDGQMSVREVEDAVRQYLEDADKPKVEATGATRRLRPPGLVELEELLSEHLSTRVQVSMGAKRGKVVVEFATLEDLERIYRAMTEASRGHSTNDD